MAKWIPFTKSYEVKCGNGTVKTIYKKVEYAFPLSINGYEANISANVKSELLSEGGLDGNLKSKDRKSTRLNSSHTDISRMPSSA